MPKAATSQMEAHEDRAAWRSTWKQSAKTFILVIASWSTPRTTSRATTKVCIKSGRSLTASTTSSLSKICTRILKRRERSHSMIPLASKTAGIYSWCSLKPIKIHNRPNHSSQWIVVYQIKLRLKNNFTKLFFPTIGMPHLNHKWTSQPSRSSKKATTAPITQG